jgi:hypothetical protein
MRRLVERLGSKALTAYLVLAYAVFLVFLAVWGARIPKEVVGNISRLAPFWVIYAAAALHLACCLVAWWPSLARRTSLDLPEAALRSPVRLPPSGELAAQARKAGLRVRWLEPGRVAVLHRNRLSPLGTALGHAALLLLPVAFLVSRATRFEGRAWIVEGHVFGGTRSEYVSFEPEPAFEARAPRVAIGVESVDAEFWGDRLFFTDLRALVSLPGTLERRIIRLPQPAWIDGARVTLKGFNYTPAFQLLDERGRVLERGDLRLWLFPPGTEDSFTLPGLPHRIWVRLYPDSAGPRGAGPGQGHHLQNPLFHVAVTCGKRLVGHGWLRPGEPFPFDGYQIAFPAVRRAGEIVVHRDRGYPVLWLALGLALAGTAARVLFPSSRLWVVVEESGGRAVARDDAFAAGRASRLLDAWRTHAR